jgi:hypothetical protein
MHTLTFWLPLAIAAAMTFGSFIFLARHKAVTRWDIGLCFAPFIIWWLLAFLNLRPKSLSNFIEFFYLILLVPGILVIRALAFAKKPQWASAPLAFSVALIVTVAIYVFVPALPE